MTVRNGSVFAFSEFGQQAANPGDVILLGANVLCGFEPEGHVTATTVLLDLDYLVDQVFWQNAEILRDRLDALELAESVYVEHAQIMHIGVDCAGALAPWLDELVAFSIDAEFRQRFNRVQVNRTGFGGGSVRPAPSV